MLTLAALALERWRSDRTAAAADIVPGLVAGAAVLTRDIGLAVIIALMARALVTRRGYAFAGALIGAGFFVAWRSLRASYSIEVDYLPLIEQFAARFASEPIAFPLANLTALLHGGVVGSSWSALPPTMMATVAVLGLSISGVIILIQRADPVAGLAVAMLGVLAIWPYAAESARLFAPFMPLLLILAALPAHAIAIRTPASRTVVTAAALLMMAGPGIELARVVPRLAWNLPGPLAAYDGTADRFTLGTYTSFESAATDRLRVALAAAQVKDAATTEERLCAANFTYLMLVTQRPVTELPAGSRARLASRIAADCDLVFVSSFAIAALDVPALHPLGLLGTGGFVPRFTSTDVRTEGSGRIVAALLDVRRDAAHR